LPKIKWKNNSVKKRKKKLTFKEKRTTFGDNKNVNLSFLKKEKCKFKILFLTKKM
jgi:hypothetical protein